MRKLTNYTCVVAGCENLRSLTKQGHSQGTLCGLHRGRKYQNGNAQATVRPIAPDGAGHITASGHRRFTFTKQIGTEYEHRLVWRAHYGNIPATHVIHHNDGNPLNNNIENLRCLTRSEHTKLHRQVSRAPQP